MDSLDLSVIETLQREVQGLMFDDIWRLHAYECLFNKLMA